MKYIVFVFAALGVPPLAALLWFNLRWARYVIWGMLAALCMYQATSINFFSHEEYLGSALFISFSACRASRRPTTA